MRNIALIVSLIFISLYSYANILTPINVIQGSQNSSKLVGKSISVSGVVTADFQENEGFYGYFIQSINTDINPLTSEGLFINDKNFSVSTGDLIEITGTVSEENTVTQLINVNNLKVIQKKLSLPHAMIINLPLDNNNLEHYENMRVQLADNLIVSDAYNYIKYGELIVSSKLLMTPSNRARTNKQINKIKHDNTIDSLLIDDGSFAKFPKFQQINVNNLNLIGSEIQAQGVMYYAYNNYRVEITKPLKVIGNKYARKQPQKIAGTIKIASFNLRNFFTTLDDGKVQCGPKQNFGCRGADSLNELTRQLKKLVAAINTANPDVIALEELENNQDSLPTLVKALNQDNNKKWNYIETGILGSDVIKVGIAYQPKNVTPVGDFAVLNKQSNPKFEETKNRISVLQTFSDNNNKLFNLAVVHLKSKRCTDALGQDKDQKDGQGCYNASRTKVAKQLSNWLNKDPTGQNAKHSIIAGDFNSYQKEDPINNFKQMGFYNLAETFIKGDSWTSIYRGKFGAIDHILVNKSAKKTAEGFTQWHINSIETGMFDYNLEPLDKGFPKPNDYYQANPFSSSDHDLIMAGFSFED